MSCGGNRFQCGIGRFSKFSTTDKPSNQELHNENQKKLSDLMRLREEQDKGNFNNFSFQPQPLSLSSNVLDAANAAANATPSHFTPFSYTYNK
jgi:hypothetical protein